MKKEMKVKIRDFNYIVKLVPENDADIIINLPNGDKTEAFGITNTKQQVIKIQDCLTEERTYQVLVHELTHAFLDIYLTDNNLKGTFDDESICCFMGSYGIDIINTANKVFCHLMN